MLGTIAKGVLEPNVSAILLACWPCGVYISVRQQRPLLGLASAGVFFNLQKAFGDKEWGDAYRTHHSTFLESLASAGAADVVGRKKR